MVAYYAHGLGIAHGQRRNWGLGVSAHRRHALQAGL